MPGLNGLDVARLLREKVPATKILIMSQHDPAVLLSCAIEAGAHACVDKNRLSTELLPIIASVTAAVDHPSGPRP
jgi:DNA-binding NarL/FixJ family response regulator